MFWWALGKMKQTFGPDHPLTPQTVGNMGKLPEEMEEMSLQASQRKEEAFVSGHTSTT